MTIVTGSNVFLWYIFDQLRVAVLESTSNTQFVYGDTWNTLTATGSGFTYANGVPTGGTITSFVLNTPASGSSTFSGLSLSATSFWTAIKTGNSSTFYAMFLGGNDTFIGTAGSDTFDISQGGDDTVYTMGGTDDVVTVGGTLTAADQIIGGGYDPSTGGFNAVRVVLNGDYSSGLTLSSTTLVNVTGLEFTAGHSYKVTLNDATAHNSYQYMSDISVNGLTLGSSDTLYFDGSAEADANLGIGGGAGNDTLIGGGVSDNISGYGGDDTIFGGGGSDTLDGGAGVNVIHGGDGDDNITVNQGGAGSQTYGDAGNDYVWGGTTSGSTCDGGSGNDYWRYYGDGSSSPHNLAISLGAGTISDGTNTGTITGFEGVSGGYGNDTLIGSASNDWLVGGNGNDTLEGGAGDDVLIGERLESTPFVENSMVFVGGSWAGLPELDTVSFAHATRGETVDPGADEAHAALPAGVAFGGDGLDHIYLCQDFILSSYNDVFIGSPIWNFNYAVFGGDGNDTIIVNTGTTASQALNTGVNRLFGGSGNDTIMGGSGSDWIAGGTGTDTVTGGAGTDTFAFESAQDFSLDPDHVTDFMPAEDKIDVSAVSGLHFIGNAAFSGVAGQLHYSFVNGQTVLSYDANGDGSADGALVLDNGQFDLFEKTAGSGVLQADITGPSVADRSLVAGGVESAPTARFVITFSEPVVAGTGSIELHKADGTLLYTVDASQGWVTVSGNTATIGFAVAPDLGASCYLTLQPGTFTDALGNSFAGATSPSALTFVMPTAIPNPGPALQSTAVDKGADGTSLNPTITLVFDAPVHPVSGTIMLSNAQANMPFITISATDTSQVTVSGNTLIITPKTPLFGGTNYMITGGNLTVANASGDQSLVYLNTASFTTAPRQDTVLPSLISAAVGDGSAAVSPDSNIVLTFSETVKPGYVWAYTGLSYDNCFWIVRSDGTLVKSIASSDSSQVTFSGNTVTINPNVDLPGDTTFKVYYGAYAVQDLAGNFNGASDIGLVNITGLNLATSFTTASKFNGTKYNDVMPGTASADTIYGLGGDDQLAGLAGNDTIDGGAGTDTAVFSGNRAAYAITHNADGSATVSGPDGTDTLISIERLQFANATVATCAVAANDYSGSGTSAILWQNDSGQAAIWTMNGFTQTGGSPVGGNPGPSWHVVGSGDFFGDGKADILWQNDDGSTVVWTMDGLTQTGSAWVGVNPGPTWHVKSVADFNGDGKADILWQNDSGQAAVWEMNGDTVTAGSYVGGNPGTSWHVVGAGDFNGDSKADIVWQNTGNGQVVIWTMDGFNQTGSDFVGGAPGSDWHVKGVGDFYGTGQADLLWQNDDGRALIWTMNGVTQTGSDFIGGNSGPTWHIQGTGDYNGDGCADILWQNDNGQAAIWTMNGVTQLGGSLVGGNPGTTWHIPTGVG